MNNDKKNEKNTRNNGKINYVVWTRHNTIKTVVSLYGEQLLKLRIKLLHIHKRMCLTFLQVFALVILNYSGSKYMPS